MKIYVASSWRNTVQPDVVALLRTAGHEVYDFKNPPNRSGFGWEQLCENWRNWSLSEFIEALKMPIAKAAFKSDYDAMQWADAGVLVMPCGRSAHLEAGYFVGAGKPLIILLSEGEPELMYKMADGLCLTVDDVLDDLNRYECEYCMNRATRPYIEGVPPLCEKCYWGSDLQIKREKEIRGIEHISRERIRQINDEKISDDQDDAYRTCELARAAACYALTGFTSRLFKKIKFTLWPWADTWWKPTTYLRNLEKAGALIAAEIDRVLRVQDREKQGECTTTTK